MHERQGLRAWHDGVQRRQELLEERTKPCPKGFICQDLHAGFDILVSIKGVDTGLGEDGNDPSMTVAQFRQLVLDRGQRPDGILGVFRRVRLQSLLEVCADAVVVDQ